MATGTFSVVGAGPSVVVNDSADLSLVFEGSGSVTLQRLKSGGWRNVPGGTWSADTEDIVYSGRMHAHFRLNCTESGGDIHWELG